MAGQRGHQCREFNLQRFDATPLVKSVIFFLALRLVRPVVKLANDPVRVFQEFATLDIIPGGCAEIVVGRGSFIESYPLFGLRLEDCAIVV